MVFNSGHNTTLHDKNKTQKDTIQHITTLCLIRIEEGFSVTQMEGQPHLIVSRKFLQDSPPTPVIFRSARGDNTERETERGER